MARTIEHPVAPRISPPDLPDELSRGYPSRNADLHGATLDLDGEVDLAHSTLDGCVVAAHAGSIDLTGATVLDVDLAEVRVASLVLRDANVRRLRIRGGRIGTLDLSGSRVEELELRELRIDYLTLGAARAEDLLIVDCTIRALDTPQAELKRVCFERSRADEVDSRGMRAADVDLRGLETLAFLDTNSLRGTTMSAPQAELLAVALATGAGIQIKD